MTLIHSDGKSILLRSIHIWLASYWQLTPIKRALGHSLDIMGSASNYVHCEQIQIAISNLDFTENFKVFRKLEATCHVLLFSLRNSTLASQIWKKEKIISHTTGTRTRDLAIREHCSNQLSYSMTLIHSDGKSILLRSIHIWLAS